MGKPGDVGRGSRGAARARSVSGLAGLAWLASLAGCSAIAGLDGIQEQACAPSCGDSGVLPDGTTPAEGSTADTGAPINDSSVQAEGAQGDDSAALEDTSTPGLDSAAQDSGAGKDGASAGASDAVSDAPPFSDAPFDSGCGDLNTVVNCSACNDKCAAVDTIQTSASCPGSTNGAGASCQYTCATGHLDCNGPAGTNPPNLDGCECAVPAGVTQAQCCAKQGGDCPVAHTNGLSGSTMPPAMEIQFFDCVPTGTMNATLAYDACVAFVGASQASQCQAYGQADSGTADSYCNGGNSDTAANGDCICWTFSGPNAGTFLDPAAAGIPSPQNCYYGQTTGTFN